MSVQNKVLEDSFLNINQIFGQQKGLIALVTILFTCLCAVLIFNYKPVYEAKIILDTPNEVVKAIVSETSYDYLHTIDPKISDVTLSDLFIRYVESSHVMKCFYKENSLLVNRWHRYFLKQYLVQEDVSNKQKKIIVTARANNTPEAIKDLKLLLAFIQKFTINKIILLIKKNKTIERQNLLEQINLLQAIVLSNKDLPKKINDSYPSAIEELIKIYEKIYKSYSYQIRSIYFTNPFIYNSKIITSNTILNEKIKITLILGLFGGLILGFFAATFRLGIEKRIFLLTKQVISL